MFEDTNNRRRSSVSLESCSLASISEENNITQAALIPLATRSTDCSSALSSVPSSDEDTGEFETSQEMRDVHRIHASCSSDHRAPFSPGHSPCSLDNVTKLHNTVVSRNLRRCQGQHRRKSSPDVTASGDHLYTQQS